MDRTAVKRLVDDELADGEAFANLHGITSENVHEFLVEPTSVTVITYGSEPGPREMWLVLQEEQGDAEGYFVVFDPSRIAWGLAMHNAEGQFVLVSGVSDTFLGAVEGM